MTTYATTNLGLKARNRCQRFRPITTERRTAEIVRSETQLNQRVYALFDLSSAEVRIIEESTKYRYGEV